MLSTGQKIALAIKKLQQTGGWCETNEIEVRLASSMWDLASSMWDLVNSSAQLFGLGLDSRSALSLRFGVGLKSFCHSIRHCSSSLAWRHGFLTRRCPLARAAGRGRGCCPLAGLLSHSLVRRILHLVRSVWERQGWERQGFPIGCDGCDSPALCNRSLNSRVPTWMSPLEKSTLKYLGALQDRCRWSQAWTFFPYTPPFFSCCSWMCLRNHHQAETMSGVAQWLACWAHNPKFSGSKPGSAMVWHDLLSCIFRSASVPHHKGLFWELNPGPLAPWARIIPRISAFQP